MTGWLPAVGARPCQTHIHPLIENQLTLSMNLFVYVCSVVCCGINFTRRKFEIKLSSCMETGLKTTKSRYRHLKWITQRHHKQFKSLFLLFSSNLLLVYCAYMYIIHKLIQIRKDRAKGYFWYWIILKGYIHKDILWI